MLVLDESLMLGVMSVDMVWGLEGTVRLLLPVP